MTQAGENADLCTRPRKTPEPAPVRLKDGAAGIPPQDLSVGGGRPPPPREGKAGCQKQDPPARTLRRRARPCD